MIIFIGVTSPMNIPVRGAMHADLTGGPIWGSGVAPSLTRDPLTDEYKNFIFLLLLVLAVSPNRERPKQAEYAEHTTANSQYSLQQVHDKRNKFDNSRL
jgi:hypothetical protein